MAVVMRRVPLQRPECGSGFRRSMAAATALGLISCNGRSERSREFRNSTG